MPSRLFPIFIMTLILTQAYAHISRHSTLSCFPPESGFYTSPGDSCKIQLDKKTEKTYNLATVSFKHGNYTQAMIMLKEVLKNEPACTDAAFLLGLINFKKANPNYQDAEKYFMQVLNACPSYDPYVYFYLGQIAYDSEHYDDAVKYLETFMKQADKIKSDEDCNKAALMQKYAKFMIEILAHPVPFEPKVVEGISTPQDEYLPILSPDNQMALFTRLVKLEGDKNSVVSSARTKEKFMFSTLDKDGNFSAGEEMPEPFNIQDNEGGASLTADNNTLYYTVCKYDNARHYLNCDIYYSERVNGEWTPIKSVSDKINLPYSWESQPSISADGKTLYFVSDRQGGYGGYDIYRSIKTDNGEWGTPINLGPVINSPGNEKSPFIHPDGKTLYFSSDGWLGLGGYDIFYSRLNDNGTWTRPKNLGYPINSPDDEVGFFVSTDGSKGFFASNKYSGKGGWDLYSFNLYEAARPEKILFLKGTVLDENTAEPVKARIELKNVETKKVEEIHLDSNTGNYVKVAPFDNDYVMTVKKEGFVYETKYINRVDSLHPTVRNVDVEIKPIELNESYRINDIYFGFNKYDLTLASKNVLDQLIEFLMENPGINIQIQGHTDNIGNDADNLKLSDNRARSVYNYLVLKGISVTRLQYKGFGKTMPVADNDTEEGRAKNRRTVFVITKK
jgi:outer membrane protein OmpA-like peptidoglycan-associated protein/tetratricopeptide (TPR) repeat protein